MAYHLIYSQTSHDQVRSLHPDIKSLVKRKIQELKQNPFVGKALEKDLSGYRSFRAKRYRIIYKIVREENTVQIHYVGHRKDIYEVFREIVTKQSP